MRHLPHRADPEARRAHARADARWGEHRRELVTRRAQVALDAEEAVGPIGVRELMLIGAVMYWCEGAKAKPWREQYRLDFINSDPALLELFLAFLDAVGVPRSDLRCRVSIHETADADLATRWWAERLGLPAEVMRRPNIKRHAPATVRRNTSHAYRGCLTVTVPRGRELYRWIQAAMSTLATGLEAVAFPRDRGLGLG